MELKYPSDIIEVLKRKWVAHQNYLYVPKKIKDAKKKGEIIALEFPSDDKLKIILDIVYHASFLTEESNRICHRIGYMYPSKSNKKHFIFNLTREPLRLLNPIEFSIHELLKISPSINPHQSILLICEGEKIETNLDSEKLYFWGVIDLGSEWWDYVSGIKTQAAAPPNILTISSNTPGNITATSAGTILFSLVAGEILESPLKDLSQGIIGKFLKNTANKLYAESLNILKVKKYSKYREENKYPYILYYRVLNNILQYSQEVSHGATIILVPDEINIKDTNLSDKVNLKYIFDKDLIWDDLVKECVANYYHFRLSWRKISSGLASRHLTSTKDLHELIYVNEIHNKLEKKILDFEKFVAQLSCVDGAVVLSTKFRVLGYGGEITGQPSNLKYVLSAKDPLSKTFSKVNTNNFGTRHRSAFRFCQSFKNCIVFVISQDGGIKAIKRFGVNVVYWHYNKLIKSSL